MSSLLPREEEVNFAAFVHKNVGARKSIETVATLLNMIEWMKVIKMYSIFPFMFCFSKSNYISTVKVLLSYPREFLCI